MAKIDLRVLEQALVEGVSYRAVLSKLLRNEKQLDFDGRPGKAVDFTIKLLQDVTTKRYTKANHDNDDDFVFDRIDMDVVAVQLEDMIYAALQVDNIDTMVVTVDNVNSYAPIIDFLIDLIINDLEESAATTITSGTNNAVTITGANKKEQGSALIEDFQEQHYEFNTRKVDPSNRIAVVGNNVAARLVASTELLSVANSGSDSALRDATIGRVASFTCVSSSQVPPNVAVFFNRNAFVLASEAPGNLTSVAYSSEVSDPDALIDLRVIVTSLGKRVADGIIAQTYFTTKLIDPARQKKVTYNFTTPAA